jgi:hypothetical protein
MENDVVDVFNLIGDRDTCFNLMLPYLTKNSYPEYYEEYKSSMILKLDGYGDDKYALFCIIPSSRSSQDICSLIITRNCDFCSSNFNYNLLRIKILIENGYINLDEFAKNIGVFN